MFSFRMVVFYLVTTGWIFDISSCENSINEPINNSVCVCDALLYFFVSVVVPIPLLA